TSAAVLRVRAPRPCYWAVLLGSAQPDHQAGPSQIDATVGGEGLAAGVPVRTGDARRIHPELTRDGAVTVHDGAPPERLQHVRRRLLAVLLAELMPVGQAPEAQPPVVDVVAGEHRADRVVDLLHGV